jgi:hypothetical protein
MGTSNNDVSVLLTSRAEHRVQEPDELQMRVDVGRTFALGAVECGSREQTFDLEDMLVDDLLTN